jgi:hypothetical protein
VDVTEKQDWILALDYEVGFDAARGTYRVAFTRGGHFEEAYRFIERWIGRHAAALDGVEEAIPEGYQDYRGKGWYWMVERPFDRLMADLRGAVEARIRWLQRARPNEGVLGEVTVEARVKHLRRLVAYLTPVEDDVRAAVHSPETDAFVNAVLLADERSDAADRSGQAPGRDQ